MKKITVDELVDYKILPFDLYNEAGEVLASAGDNVTPGKLLQLRYIKKLFCADDNIPEEVEEEIITPPQAVQKEPTENYIDTFEEENDPFENSVNHNSSIDEKSQLHLKSIYKKAYKSINTKIDGDSVKQIKNIRDRILDNILPIIHKTYKKSQLKIVGSYEKYHGLNVALLTAMLAKKMNYNDTQLSDVTLGALLHDIGKTRLPKEFHNSYAGSSSTQSTKMYELHPELGYKILKNEMRLSEDISIIALEHHEKNDGTGYPFGISNDLLHPYSQIVGICNLYDNIISLKSPIIVATPQEAVKKIIELGTNWFLPEILYSFVYMTTYHDDIPIEELCNTGNTNWE
ncbi:MAG: HD domain-containing protein [Candidatus Gastranaerophilales bacterium]|nr:HD domain-containing protein [Candidatus Gastranaerophilales bacterium]